LKKRSRGGEPPLKTATGPAEFAGTDPSAVYTRHESENVFSIYYKYSVDIVPI